MDTKHCIFVLSAKCWCFCAIWYTAIDYHRRLSSSAPRASGVQSADHKLSTKTLREKNLKTFVPRPENLLIAGYSIGLQFLILWFDLFWSLLLIHAKQYCRSSSDQSELESQAMGWEPQARSSKPFLFRGPLTGACWCNLNKRILLS